MEFKESFSVEEITSIIEKWDVETSLESFRGENRGEENWTLNCEYGLTQFSVFFAGTLSDCHGILFSASREVEDNPSLFVNNFNSDHLFCSAYFEGTDSGIPKMNWDDKFEIHGRCLIPFNEGITASHLEFLIAMWIEDLCDFYEVVFVDDEELLEMPEIHEQVREMTIAEQIEWALGDAIPRSARELAEHLMVDKHTINSNLYANKALFQKDSGQPPRWTLAKPKGKG